MSLLYNSKRVFLIARDGCRGRMKLLNIGLEESQKMREGFSCTSLSGVDAINQIFIAGAVISLSANEDDL